MRPSKIRQKEDLALVISSLKINKFKPYEDKFNPYRDGIRYDRFERYYKREYKHFINADRDWKDLCEVYGLPYNAP